ncbi:MAG: DEAD/DEAH box helicase [Nitrospirota bacterium]|nr:DEAD/DEAH box helicase [Nitrospirota bacterium]
MAPADSDLLRLLATLPANAVYTLAPKASVIRGFDYYRRGRLEGYEWSPDRSTLTAYVRGVRLYAVACAADADGLTFSCDCPAWMPEWQCKHVVCAFLTTANLLSPAAFAFPGSARFLRDKLRESLLADRPRAWPKPRAKALAPRFEIVIDARSAYPLLAVRKNGQPLHSPVGVPAELAGLITSSVYAYGSPWDALPAFLRSYGRAYPLVLETTRGPVPLAWDPAARVRANTQLHVVGDRVEVRAVCLVNGAARERIHHVRGLVADLDAKTLVRIKDQETRGWALYCALRQLFHDGVPGYSGYGEAEVFGAETVAEGGMGAVALPGQPVWDTGHWWNDGSAFHVPLTTFQSVQITLAAAKAKAALEDLILRAENKEWPLHVSHSVEGAPAPSYSVTIDPDDDRSHAEAPPCLLKAAWRLGTFSAPPAAPAFGLLTYLDGNRIPAPLRALKRRGPLIQAFFKALDADTKVDRDRIIDDTLSGEAFGRRHVRTEARRIVRHFVAAAVRPELCLYVDRGRWALASIEKRRQALLYRIPFDLFGTHPFRSMRRHDAMALPSDVLHDGLPELQARLEQAGIALYYNGKPVVRSRWACSLEARRETGIDWFELRPEIRCEGVVVEETVWEEVSRRGGVLETERCIQVLDANTWAILRSLSDIRRSAAAQAAGRQGFVRVPRLHILDWLALREQGVTVRLPAEDHAMLDRLTRFERIETPAVPRGLNATLRPYQLNGYAWLAFLYQHRLGACLADDMGLGKTLQAISLLGGITEGLVPAPWRISAPHLIVVPPSLLFNWEHELARFYPKLKVRCYTGSARHAALDDGDVVLTTYGLVRRDIERLANVPFHVIVFDEAQAVKNLYADTTGAVRRLNGAFKLAMTGTPLENHLGEYYSLIDLCLPGLLGDYDRFKPLLKLDRSPELERILRRTKPFVLRRTKEAVLQDLPPKTETDLYLDLTDRQKALYQQTVAQARQTVDGAYRSNTAAQARIIALAAILKLRQVCLSPVLLTEQPEEISPKIAFLLDQLRELAEEGHSALVFSQFTSFLDLVEDAVKSHGLTYARLDGRTATGRRKRLVQRFQAEDGPSVFLLSLKAGGQGLNLTRATYVFHLDPWWNPAVERQASDRAHRIGQKRAVSITRILMRHTIEEKMMQLKRKKQALYDAVLGSATHRPTGSILSKSDFDFLLGGW